MRSKLFFLFAPIVALSASSLWSQSSAPVVIQAAPANSTPALPTPSPSGDTTSFHDATELLTQIKAANEETIKKQQAVLDTLDELQKAADQIRIFSKRG